MRSILLLTFLTTTFFTFAQSIEKGNPSYCQFRLTVHHADGSSENIENLQADVTSYFSGIVDTIVYVLEDDETVTADFYIVSPFISSTQFHEELIYGLPVSDTTIDGYTSVGGGTPTWNRTWDFADSALFTFFLYGGAVSNPIHTVKLTRTPQAPLLVNDQSVLPISIFPNPAADHIYIQIPDDHPMKLLLVDATGRELKSWENNVSHSLDLTAFQSGSYFIHVVSNGKVSVFKVEKVE